MRKQATEATLEVHSIPTNISDPGKVRLGGESPSFGPVRLARESTIDKGKVRLGGESPSFGPIRVAPLTTVDKGKVRLGGESPSFGPVRARVR